MRVGVLVNDAASLRPEQTTSLLADRARARGHLVHFLEVGRIGQGPDGEVRAGAPGGGQAVVLDDLDVVLVRTNPARDLDRAWAHQAASLLLRTVADRGVRVHNAPEGLVWAATKLFLGRLPPEIRPRTLASRDPDELARFVATAPGEVVLKPAVGTHGADVFRVSPARPDNLPQILAVLVRQGLALAQDYVAEARDGDVRLLVVDGELFEVGGAAAAVRRVPPASDFRSNVAIGGTPAPVDVTEDMRRVVRLAAPVLSRAGLRVAGLDLVGSRVVEVNVFSPGGLFDAQRLYGVDFAGALVDALLAPASPAIG